MRLAETIGLPPADRRDVFYALLLKDAGCSNNSTRVHQLFGGSDHRAKRGVWLRDWRRLSEQIAYALEHVEPDGSFVQRFRKFARLATLGPRGARELFQLRCDRGAEIALAIGFGHAVANAIRTMDEHWDGWGYPAGLRGESIPMAARIIGLAQVVEIFSGHDGPPRAVEVARERSGRWFDPELVKALRDLESDSAFWSAMHPSTLDEAVAAAEPGELLMRADADGLDRIARAFAWVIDAKSSFTFAHSERVADMTASIAERLGLDDASIRSLRRAALLHDIGKLGVPNRILDKPAALTANEWEIVKAHPRHTFEILERIPGFGGLAFEASLHHERMDGRGYHRGVPGRELPVGARIMAVADVYDALSADRPYRAGMPLDRVLGILKEDAGTALCGDCVSAVESICSVSVTA